jgi:Signal transduction histidine kinase
LTVGAAVVTVAVVRWIGVARHRRQLLLDRERRARAQRSELERQADRLEAFASVVSHDLRNPLEVARGRLEAARTRVEGGDPVGDGEARTDLDAVDDSLDRMEQIIDDALALARIGPAAVDPAAVSLADVAHTAWDGVTTGEATLTVTAETGVVADETYLRRLFENLFRNAVEHAGTAPTVTVAPTETGFRVDDDGPGIPPDRREAVTEAGHTTATAGTGFGLSIVAEIAAAHGWQLSVEAAETGGARFSFTGVETESPETTTDTEETDDWAGGVREG